MLAYLARRLLQLVPVLLVASFLVFVAARLTPQDPAVVMAGGRQTSTAVLEAIRAKYHLDESVPSQYLRWMAGALLGDLGESYRLKQGVSAMIAARLPVSLQLIAMSVAIALLAAVPLGILAALRKGSWVDILATSLSLAALSSPVFLTGILGILLFSYTLGWLPALGSGRNFAENLRYLLMPSVALALNMLALSMRMTRSGMIEAMRRPYIQTAILKGLPRRTIVLKHALRNALLPLVTITGLQIGFLLSGTVLVEYTFGLGGLGSLLVNAIQTSDYPVVQGLTLFIVSAFLLINLLVDLLYGIIDPRIRQA